MIERLMLAVTVPLWITSTAGALACYSVLYPLTLIEEALRD